MQVVWLGLLSCDVTCMLRRGRTNARQKALDQRIVRSTPLCQYLTFFPCLWNTGFATATFDDTMHLSLFETSIRPSSGSFGQAIETWSVKSCIAVCLSVCCLYGLCRGRLLLKNSLAYFDLLCSIVILFVSSRMLPLLLSLLLMVLIRRLCLTSKTFLIQSWRWSTGCCLFSKKFQKRSKMLIQLLKMPALRYVCLRAPLTVSQTANWLNEPTA